MIRVSCEGQSVLACIGSVMKVILFICFRNASEQGATVVKMGGDECMDQCFLHP